jgi:hypothetical protein
MLASWFVAGMIVRFAIIKSRQGTVGLPIAYLVGFALLHWPGAAVYLTQGFYNSNPDTVFAGFTLTTYGLIGYCLGIIVPRFFMMKPKVVSFAHMQTQWVISGLPVESMAKFFVLLGLFSEFLLMPSLGYVATLSALLSGLSSLAVVGVCLGAWNTLVRHDMRRLAQWVLVAFSFPLISLTHLSFLGYGVHKLIIFLSFIAGFRRIRLKKILLIVLLLYFGLSLFVTYMRDRSGLREMTWQRNAGYSERIGYIWNMVATFELFDPSNNSHLVAIDNRLNQNYLVGRAKEYIKSGGREFAYGETVWQSLVALVPRAFWPGKPKIGGGGTLVSDYTGLAFNEGTSVGTGQVFEFYINFGTVGVIAGFIFLGALINLFDTKAASFLLAGDFRGFILWFLPGIGLLQAGGNLVELTSTVGASIGSALLALALTQRYTSRASKRRKIARAF